MKIIAQRFWLVGLSLTLLTCLYQPLIAQKKEKDKKARKAYNEASKAFRKKNYTYAVYKGVTALNGTLKKKQRVKALKIVGSSYMTFYGNSITEINNLKEENEEYQGIQTVRAFDRVVKLYRGFTSVVENIKKLDASALTSANIDQNTLVDYTPELELNGKKYQEAEDRFVSDEYVQGLLLLEEKTKLGAYRAYFRFSNAQHFQPNFKKVRELKSRSKSEATYLIKITPTSDNIPDNKFKGIHITADKGLKNTLKNNRYAFKDFIKIVDEGMTDVIPDLHITSELTLVTLQTGDLQVDEIFEEKEIVVKEEKVKKSDGSEEKVKIKKTVNAKLKLYERSKWARANGSAKVENIKKETVLIDQKELQATEQSYISWLRLVAGDKRALSSSQKRRVEEKQPQLETSSNLAHGAALLFGYKIGQKLLERMSFLFSLTEAERVLQEKPTR